MSSIAGSARAALGQRDTDACAERELASVDVDRLMHGIEDARRESFRLMGRIVSQQDDGELVAAEARHRVATADAAGQAPRRQFQQLVAGHVPKRVVDVAEAVEIDQEHGDAGSLRQSAQRITQPLDQQQAVRKPGQSVMLRHMGDGVVLALELGRKLRLLRPRPPCAR